MTWPEDPDEPERERRLMAEVDFFGEALKDPDEPDIYDKRYPLREETEQFCDYVELSSHFNKEWAVGLWHVLLGVILRNQRVRIGDTHLDGRIHLLVMAPSASGKTLAVNQLEKVIERCRLRGEEGLKVRSVVAATDAALVGSARERKVKGESVREVVPGILNSTDLIRWDEGTAIFADSGYNVHLLRILNMSMNAIDTPGNVITKELAGVTNEVRPRCSLVVTMVDDPRVLEHVFRCGFYQRMLVMRRVPTDEDLTRVELRRKELMDHPEQVRGAGAATGQTIDFLELLDKVYGGPSQARPWDFHLVTGFIHKKWREMLDAANVHPELAPYLREFPARYGDRLRVLAMHNAALRLVADGGPGDRVVLPDDAKAAWWLVARCARQFFAWTAEVAYQWGHLHRRNIRQRALDRTS